MSKKKSNQISDLKDLANTLSLEELDAKIKDNYGISLSEMAGALSVTVQERADEIVQGFMNIAPMGDYSKLLLDYPLMAQFLREEAHKPEHWQVYGLMAQDNGHIEFVFSNDSVDDGETFKGYVLINSKGDIKHVFAQAEE
jgi:hypothetical protein